MEDRKWIRVVDQLPSANMTVETKIDDGTGIRNQQILKRHRNLWWPEKGDMYVYYTPTHWRYKQVK